ncbi:hypothetical protein ABAC460_05200 [Asticcacaulis sp. AC460]|uniref:hypothetical protein n=1 Tax=Asticcacaulis sp. AC460 TaxID=1282360 RepID=UPI0003C3FBCC|nr:hypothetical protein [Asticcacaulis sp. AC460]ESQ91738.1 hypothetical protein ABAC460_05200 [Asticcacaulis sp. AC460]
MDMALITALAAKYIWWKPADEAARTPYRVIAQVMDIGEYNDVQKLIAAIGPEPFCEVLRRAEPGQLNARSWHYWHYRLHMAEIDHVPPLPQRRLA